MRFLPSFLALLFLSGSLLAQVPSRQGRKPVLIRDDPNEKAAVEEAIKPDPKLALETIKVGDFYFRRDNYKAAEQRYRDAVKYNPKLAEAYDKLVKTLEKQKSFAEAVTVCEGFVSTNPSAREVAHFQEWAGDLRTKLPK